MIDNIITKTKNAKKAIDFRDGLQPSGVDNYAALHSAGGSKSSTVKSTIKVVICDYSSGTGNGKSKTVQANLGIDTIARLYEAAAEAIRPRVAGGISIDPNSCGIAAAAHKQAVNLYTAVRSRNYEFDKEKMLEAIELLGKSLKDINEGIRKEYGPTFQYFQARINPHDEDKQTGMASVNKLTIARAGIRPNGEIARNPWTITISNGIAKINRSATGACTYSESTYQEQASTFVIVSDEDMFRMMQSCQRFISVWEISVGLGQIIEGQGKRAQEVKEFKRGKKNGE